jgi:hypothetical protein
MEKGEKGRKKEEWKKIVEKEVEQTEGGEEEGE